MPDNVLPLFTVDRVRAVVNDAFADVRTGESTLIGAQSKILDSLDSFAEQRAAMARLRDAEVTAAAEGIVSRNPRDTSAQAAARVAPRAGSQRGRLLAYLVTQPAGATDFMAARDLRLLPNSVRPRRLELIAGGYVVDSGRTVEHRGSKWIVWLPTDEAREWYRRNGDDHGAAAA